MRVQATSVEFCLSRLLEVDEGDRCSYGPTVDCRLGHVHEDYFRDEERDPNFNVMPWFWDDRVQNEFRYNGGYDRKKSTQYDDFEEEDDKKGGEGQFSTGGSLI